MLNLADIQDEILEHLKSTIPQRVEEQAIPDAQTVLRDEKGNIMSYVALQFGDLQDKFSGKGFVGVRRDNYDLPIYAQAVSPTPGIARRIANEKVLDSLLGLSTDWTGQVRKRPGGGMWPLIASNGATEAYLFPVSFAVTLQLNDLD